MRAVGWWLGALASLLAAAGALLHAGNSAAGRTTDPSFWLMGVSAAAGYGALAMALRQTDARSLQFLAAGVGLSQGAAVLSAEAGLLAPSASHATWLVWLGS